jgi:hypothetical protein
MKFLSGNKNNKHQETLINIFFGILLRGMYFWTNKKNEELEKGQNLKFVSHFFVSPLLLDPFVYCCLKPSVSEFNKEFTSYCLTFLLKLLLGLTYFRFTFCDSSKPFPQK